MIRSKSGNIFESEADALVNTVNCVGVMGRGLALQFKKAFPQNFEEYRQACDRGEVVPGRMFITEPNTLTSPKFIVNFPTKRHWKGKSKTEDIEAGLSALRDEIEARHISSIAIPPLGSDLGGLHWPDVRRLIVSALSSTTADVILYEPGEAPNAKAITRISKPPRMTTRRAVVVALVDRYWKGLCDPFVTLIDVHKLMYFMQAAGEPLDLKFKKYHYGPYAENLRQVLNAIEGYFISGSADVGDIWDKQIELVPGAVDDAATLLRKHQNTTGRLERVSKLVEGFESSFGLELLATVHWLLHKEGIMGVDQLVERLHSRENCRQRFIPGQIHLAFDRIFEDGWNPEQVPAT